MTAHDNTFDTPDVQKLIFEVLRACSKTSRAAARPSFVETSFYAEAWRFYETEASRRSLCCNSSKFHEDVSSERFPLARRLSGRIVGDVSDGDSRLRSFAMLMLHHRDEPADEYIVVDHYLMERIRAPYIQGHGYWLQCMDWMHTAWRCVAASDWTFSRGELERPAGYEPIYLISICVSARTRSPPSSCSGCRWIWGSGFSLASNSADSTSSGLRRSNRLRRTSRGRIDRPPLRSSYPRPQATSTSTTSRT